MLYFTLMHTLGKQMNIFSKAYNSRYLIKNHANLSTNKSITSRVFSRESAILKPNARYSSLCLQSCRKPNKNLVPFYCKIPATTFRHFHTSERRYLHPALWTILRPVFKVLALITGRAFRKWWRSLPPNKKKYIWHALKENRHKIAIVIVACFGLSTAYYVEHIEETPITKRKRFIAFSPKQLEKINEYELEQLTLELESQMLPAYHPHVRRVENIVKRILTANKEIEEIKEKKWGVSVINSSVENAFVIPIGHVFVFTGMLNLCSNDDELGGIIAHEIAHCIQNHGAEKLSYTHLLDLISIAIIGAIWAVVPSDMLSLFTSWLYHSFIKVFFDLPYNRQIETEADYVGLQLAAKACFDVRESSAFWSKMAFLQNYADNKPDIEFLSTHPSHEKRSEYLDSIMDEAIKFRYECGCPRLKRSDPRENVQIMAKVLDATRKKFLLQNPKPYIHFRI